MSKLFISSYCFINIFVKLTRSTIDPILLSCAGILFPLWTVCWVVSNWSWSNLALLVMFSWFMSMHITMFAHRAWCHKSWYPSWIVNWWGMIFFTLCLVGNSIGWVGVHREHHRYCDSPKDPHSPYHKSRWSIQFFSYFNKVKTQYIVDVGRDRLHLNFYHWYWAINLTWFVLLYFINPTVLGIWIAAIGLTIFKMHTINSLCHNTPKILLPIDNNAASSNSILLILFNINNGEAWHKNHHQDPANWNFGQAWWQLDPPAWIIRLLTALRLARVRSI